MSVPGLIRGSSQVTNVAVETYRRFQAASLDAPPWHVLTSDERYAWVEAVGHLLDAVEASADVPLDDAAVSRIGSHLSGYPVEEDDEG